MSEMKEVICTCCPQGCHLQVDEANDYKVTGNGCPNGIAYGKEELTHPTRIITSTVRAEGCLHSRCPVKTSKPVPKGQMAEVVAALDSVVLHAPIHVGDVVLTDVCGTGADIVTCRDIWHKHSPFYTNKQSSRCILPCSGCFACGEIPCFQMIVSAEYGRNAVQAIRFLNLSAA